MASTHILCTGRIVDGEMHYDISPPPIEETSVDGLLQATIDEAEMSEDYESWLEDVDFFRSGC